MHDGRQFFELLLEGDLVVMAGCTCTEADAKTRAVGCGWWVVGSG